MIQKFRKKPVVVEAIELKDDYNAIIEAVEFVYSIGMETSVLGMNATVKKVRDEGGFIITTKEGDMKAVFGDYIVKEPFPTDDRAFTLVSLTFSIRRMNPHKSRRGRNPQQLITIKRMENETTRPRNISK